MKFLIFIFSIIPEICTFNFRIFYLNRFTFKQILFVICTNEWKYIPQFRCYSVFSLIEKNVCKGTSDLRFRNVLHIRVIILKPVIGARILNKGSVMSTVQNSIMIRYLRLQHRHHKFALDYYHQTVIILKLMDLNPNHKVGIVHQN